METRAEKMARLERDPLTVLYSDVHELIFQHLNFNDIINSSLVSNFWYEKTGESPKCMEKTPLKVTEEPPESSNLNEIMDRNSQRKYQNIMLKEIREPNNVKIVQLLDGRKWKTVDLWDCELTRYDYCEIFKVIEQFVEDLHITSSNFIRDDNDASAWAGKFPKLTELKLFATPCDANDANDSIADIIEFFGDCKSLKIFQATGIVRYSIEKILSKNNKLETLAVASPFPGTFELNYQFKLKSFTLIDEMPNINFLKSQANSLEYLEVEVDTAVLELCFQMPKLAKLSIAAFQYYDDDIEIDFESLQLISSKSITILNIRFISTRESIPMLKALLSAAPELQSLSLYDNDIDEQSFMQIGINCKKLEALHIKNLPSIGLISNPWFLQNLTRLCCRGEIEENFKRMIEATPPFRRTPLAQLILKKASGEITEDDWVDLTT